jgi:putative methionine-R-sulfoxide reductase with GAF domain
MHVPSPNPSEAGWDPSARDRRGSLRRQPGTRSYAVGDTVVSGRVADLNEILDVSESGMGIQALWPLQIGHSADFRLDLPNPSAYVEAKGTVVWCGPSGRAGIRFAEIAKGSHGEFGAWLSANKLSANKTSAATNPAPDPAAVAPPVELQEDDDLLLCEIPAVDQIEIPRTTDYTALLTALAAVKREVESLGNDRDAALHLIARRAQAFTRASGVAIALSEGSEMTCRATAGTDTPPVGARLQIGSGFSGECVRRGTLLHCKDAETDTMVDQESCRALGIRSMVAVPIRLADQITGLLEAFSPEANNFGPDDEVVLQRLALIIGDTVLQRRQKEENVVSKPAPSSVDDEFPVETPADLPLPQFSPSRNGLLISAVITVLIAIFWLIGTWDGNRVNHPGLAASQLQTHRSSPSTTAALAANDLDGLRQLAEQGDATAQFALGTRYAAGQDVPQDYAEAMRWFVRAAEQGNVIAQTALAAYYWAGRGVAPDPAKAYFWSLVAQAGGDETSKSRLTALESRLSRGEIAMAHQQADEWLKQHPVERKDTTSTQ